MKLENVDVFYHGEQIIIFDKKTKIVYRCKVLEVAEPIES